MKQVLGWRLLFYVGGRGQKLSLCDQPLNLVAIFVTMHPPPKNLFSLHFLFMALKKLVWAGCYNMVPEVHAISLHVSYSMHFLLRTWVPNQCCTEATAHSDSASYSCSMRRLLFQNFLYSAGNLINVVIFAAYSSQCAIYFEKCGQRWNFFRRWT